MKWQDKLSKEERHHFYYATRGVMTIQAFKAARTAGLEKEPKYGCCLDCWRIANKLGLENTMPAAGFRPVTTDPPAASEDK